MSFFFNLLILWTVCRDWWLTQLYPAPTASQVTRHLGLAETAAHWVSWKCFNRDVETVEKCIILHIATKNCTFLRYRSFAWRQWWPEEWSAVYSLMVGGQDASSWHAVDVWRNLHKSLQKFATVLHQRCVIALQLLCSYLRGVGRQTYLLVVHKKLSVWGEKKQEKTLFYFSARWNLQWQVNVVVVFFFDKFRRYRSLKIKKKKSLKKKSGSAVSRWALLRHKSMKGKPLMNVRYGVFSQLKTTVLK